MEQLLAFAIGLLILKLVWSKLLVPAMLVQARNELFDLRDQLRRVFISSGRKLDDKAYVAVRAAINARLRFIEDITYWELSYLVAWAYLNREMTAKAKEKLNVRFGSNDPMLDNTVSKIRKEADETVLLYAVFSSYVAMLVALIIGVAVSFYEFVRLVPKCTSFVTKMAQRVIHEGGSSIGKDSISRGGFGFKGMATAACSVFLAATVGLRPNAGLVEELSVKTLPSKFAQPTN